MHLIFGRLEFRRSAAMSSMLIGSPSQATLVDMCSTCKYATSMAKMIQVRNVPDALHRILKAKAAMSGMSLSDYLLREFREIAERPTLSEFRERLHARESVPVALDTARLLCEERAVR